MAKTCPVCKQTYLRPELHFGKNKTVKDGFSTYCKQCLREMNNFTKEKKKPPKDIRECENENCNKTFATRNKDKKYCCTKCAAEQNNKIRNTDREYRFKYEFGYKFKNKKLDNSKKFKKWTDKEDGILLNLKFNNLTFWEIAEKLNRSYYSCGQRHRMLIKKLGLNNPIKNK